MIEGHYEAEEPHGILITVQDLNDNSPVFEQNLFLGSVEEASKPGLTLNTFIRSIL